MRPTRSPETVAREEADRTQLEIDDAFTRGFEEGRKLGEEAALEQLRSLAHSLDTALTQVEHEAHLWRSNVQENIAALAVAIARQILDREPQVTTESVAALVQRAMSEFPIDQALIVRLNPVDLRTLSSPQTPGLTHERADVQWVADSRVASGGILIEGRDRVIDGRVDTALERVYRSLSDTGA